MGTTKGTELVPVQAESFAILKMDHKRLVTTIERNLGGERLSPSDLDRVKVPAGGATAWSLPTLDGEEYSPELVGVIVHAKNQRAYWSRPFEGENTPPECYSDNGIRGHGDPGGPCETCPYAQWKSAAKGSGQACKLMKILFILRPGDVLPVVLALPPTSVGVVRKYFSRLITADRDYSEVVTRFTLEKAKSEAGINYSKVVVTKAGDLTPEQAATIGEYAETLRPALDNLRANTGEFDE